MMNKRSVISVINTKIVRTSNIGKTIQQYFTHEKRTHRWIQIPKELAIIMENDSEQPIPKNVYYEYKKNKKLMREYHINTHPKLEFFYRRCQFKVSLLQSSSSSLVRMRAASSSTPSVSDAGSAQVGR